MKGISPWKESPQLKKHGSACIHQRPRLLLRYGKPQGIQIEPILKKKKKKKKKMMFVVSFDAKRVLLAHAVLKGQTVDALNLKRHTLGVFTDY